MIAVHISEPYFHFLWTSQDVPERQAYQLLSVKYWVKKTGIWKELPELWTVKLKVRFEAFHYLSAGSVCARTKYIVGGGDYTHYMCFSVGVVQFYSSLPLFISNLCPCMTCPFPFFPSEMPKRQEEAIKIQWPSPRNNTNSHINHIQSTVCCRGRNFYWHTVPQTASLIYHFILFSSRNSSGDKTA